jgi:hypothetical protein
MRANASLGKGHRRHAAILAAVMVCGLLSCCGTQRPAGTKSSPSPIPPPGVSYSIGDIYRNADCTDDGQSLAACAHIAASAAGIPVAWTTPPSEIKTLDFMSAYSSSPGAAEEMEQGRVLIMIVSGESMFDQGQVVEHMQFGQSDVEVRSMQSHGDYKWLVSGSWTAQGNDYQVRVFAMKPEKWVGPPAHAMNTAYGLEILHQLFATLQYAH